MEILNAKVEETYRHKKTGELFKEKKDWEAKGYKPEDIHVFSQISSPDRFELLTTQLPESIWYSTL